MFYRDWICIVCSFCCERRGRGNEKSPSAANQFIEFKKRRETLGSDRLSSCQMTDIMLDCAFSINNPVIFYTNLKLLRLMEYRKTKRKWAARFCFIFYSKYCLFSESIDWKFILLDVRKIWKMLITNSNNPKRRHLRFWTSILSLTIINDEDQSVLYMWDTGTRTCWTSSPFKS